jgi:hypothetical protein
MTVAVQRAVAAGTIAGLVVAAGLVIGARLLHNDPLPPVTNAAAAATLTRGTGQATAGQSVRVLAHVVSGAPLAALELWTGGSLVDRRELGGVTQVAQPLRFTPAEPGRRLLVLRVIDVHNRITHAAPLSITIGQPTGPPEVAPALRGGLGVARFATPARSGHGPAIETTVVDCQARVTVVSDSALPFLAVYDLSAAKPTFQLAVPPVANDGPVAVTLPLSGGEHAVYVQPYGPSGTGPPSAIAVVKTPDECLTKRWAGGISIVDGVLRAPGEPALAYLYVSVDNGPYTRAPATGFVQRRGGVLDVSQVLPALDTAKRIDLEAWARIDGHATWLGSTSLQAKPDEFMAALVGAVPGTSLDYVVKQSAAVDDKGSTDILSHHGEIHAYTKDGPSLSLAQLTAPYTFRWHSPLPSVTHGVWQVSMAPPLSTPNLAQPGLLAFGTVPVGESDFQIDFRPLVLPDYPPPETASGLEYGSAVPGYAVAQPFGVGGAPAQTQPKPTGGAAATAVAIGNAGVTPAYLVQLLKPAMLYVRLVPMSGEQPVDAVSNAVTFTLFLKDPSPPQVTMPMPPALNVTVDFDRPYLPDPEYTFCVRVIDNPNPFFSNPPYGAPYQVAHIGDTVCPTFPSDDDDFDLFDVFTAAGALWDEIVSAYAYLKEQAIGLLVSASGCTAFLPPNTCNTLAAIAVDAALIAIGIPPELPNTAELLALAEGELVDTVYALAEANGVSCDLAAEQCKQLMHQLLGEIVKQSQAAISDSTKDNIYALGGALPLASNIVVVPEPKGKLQPAIFRVTYTRTQFAAATLSTGCTTEGYVFGDNPSANWWDYVQNKQIENGHISGYVFVNSNTEPVNLAALQPGESVTRVVVARVPNAFFEPGAGPNNGNISYHSHPSHYYNLMFAPSTMTARIGGCVSQLVDTWTSTQYGTQP